MSQQQDYEQEFLQRRFSGGSQSYGGDSPRLSPCSSMGKLSKSDEQLSSIDQDSGQCSRNTSCETLGKTTEARSQHWTQSGILQYNPVSLKLDYVILSILGVYLKTFYCFQESNF